jgi:hypothetical protein
VGREPDATLLRFVSLDARTSDDAVDFGVCYVDPPNEQVRIHVRVCAHV